MKFSRAWVMVVAAALAACGGGGGDGGTTGGPAAGALTISGTAATGAALAGATVSVKCATGIGSATTGGNGSYTVTMSSASLPCVLEAVGGGKVFHAVVPPGTNPATANISPLTEMLVAQLGGVLPATFFSNFGNSTVVSDAAILQAIAYLKLALAGVIDLTGVNPLTDALVVGNPLDLKLDALMAALTSAGLTVDQVNAAIVANPTTPSAVASPIAPAASDCAAFRSGRYRMINPYETEARWRAHVLQIDVAAMTTRDQDGVVGSFTSSGACKFAIDDADFTNTLMVAPSGVLTVFSQSKTTASLRRITIGLPEQSLPVSEFAGTWNLAEWDLAGATPADGYQAVIAEVTFDATGHLTAAAICPGLQACVTASGRLSTLTANTAGGFDIADTSGAAGRAFMFKNVAGKLVLVAIFPDGSFAIGTPKQSVGALPAVGSTSSFHEFSFNGNGTFATVVDHVNRVTAVNATTRAVTRQREDGRIDTIGFDKPRDGLRYRAPNSCTLNNAPNNCAEVVQVPLQGMGITLALTVGTNVASAFYNFSVNTP